MSGCPGRGGAGGAGGPGGGANPSPGGVNRTIIIPQGTINPDQNNVIHVPRHFDSTAPLLVTPPRREGGPLCVQLLPDFRDRLASRSQNTPESVGYLETDPLSCKTEYMQQKRNQQETERKASSNVTWPQQCEWEKPEGEQGADNGNGTALPAPARPICPGPGPRNIVQYSTQMRSQQGGGPVEVQSFNVDAPGGISQQGMNQLIYNSNNNRNEYDPSALQYDTGISGNEYAPWYTSTPQSYAPPGSRSAQSAVNDSTPQAYQQQSGSGCACSGPSADAPPSNMYATAQGTAQFGPVPPASMNYSQFGPVASPPPSPINGNYPGFGPTPPPSTGRRRSPNVTFAIPPPPGVKESCSGYLNATGGAGGQMQNESGYRSMNDSGLPPGVPDSCPGYQSASMIQEEPYDGCDPQCLEECNPNPVVEGDGDFMPNDGCQPCYDATQQSYEESMRLMQQQQQQQQQGQNGCQPCYDAAQQSMMQQQPEPCEPECPGDCNEKQNEPCNPGCRAPCNRSQEEKQQEGCQPCYEASLMQQQQQQSQEQYGCPPCDAAYGMSQQPQQQQQMMSMMQQQQQRRLSQSAYQLGQQQQQQAAQQNCEVRCVADCNAPQGNQQQQQQGCDPCLEASMQMRQRPPTSRGLPPQAWGPPLQPMPRMPATGDRRARRPSTGIPNSMSLPGPIPPRRLSAQGGAPPKRPGQSRPPEGGPGLCGPCGPKRDGDGGGAGAGGGGCCHGCC